MKEAGIKYAMSFACALVLALAAANVAAQGGPQYATKKIADGVYHFEYEGVGF